MATLEDYRARLDREPLTSNQLGAIHREFYRLGFHVSADRAERLRLTAALAGVESIDSTKDLTMGQAGRAVGLLTGCRTARDLCALTGLRCGSVPVSPLLASMLTWVHQSKGTINATSKRM